MKIPDGVKYQKTREESEIRRQLECNIADYYSRDMDSNAEYSIALLAKRKKALRESPKQYEMIEEILLEFDHHSRAEIRLLFTEVHNKVYDGLM